ncbi:MAG: serine protease [Deltaproteobacteria bacterium]|nr:serine protease [Deltaproteobacteria bacterium]
MNASVKLLEKVLPSTVALHTQIRDDHPSAQILGTERQGSGVIVDPAGLILTVNYVVMGGSDIRVSLLGRSAQPGRVVAQDFASGLALVAIDAPHLQALVPAESSELLLGQEVFIVAAADEDNRRVHDGVISSMAPFDAYWEYSLDRAICTTAMNPGVGGGPLLDVLGRVVGIVSLDLNEVGRFTLAIPVDEYISHRDELLRHGHRVTRPPRAWIGFYCYTLRDHVVLAGVLPGTPGERAGLKAGDVVLAVDDQRINDRRQLYTQVWTHRPGENISISVFRNNEVKLITIESGDAEIFFA